jgi:dihydropteroate synthase
MQKNAFPQIMGIVNVTPDSFSDGGKHFHLEDAVKAALKMVEQGADWLDIGGESTRPGAQEVSVQEELDRVIPVINAIKTKTNVPISIDTSKATVMREAVTAGASMINDVFALQKEGALEAAADAGVPVCLMHMQGTPKTMQNNPVYTNIIKEVLAFFERRIEKCLQAGMDRKNIILDPGFGFGKTLEHNYEMLCKLNYFVDSGHQILTGLSRKSMIAKVVKNDQDCRLAGSIAAATLAMNAGAHIIRVHDVPETVDARSVLCAMKATQFNG